MSEFWDEMGTVFAASAIDDMIQERNMEGPRTSAMRLLTDKSRAAGALDLPQVSGTRVMFLANLGSVLSYSNCPGENMEGTVVTVRSAEGNTTHREGRAFVNWDDGIFRPILAEHLRLAKSKKRMAHSVRRVVADLGDLSSFFEASLHRDDELVHRATKDLWSFQQDGDNYVIERLFDDTGSPLKE